MSYGSKTYLERAAEAAKRAPAPAPVPTGVDFAELRELLAPKNFRSKSLKERAAVALASIEPF